MAGIRQGVTAIPVAAVKQLQGLTGVPPGHDFTEQAKNVLPSLFVKIVVVLFDQALDVGCGLPPLSLAHSMSIRDLRGAMIPAIYTYGGRVLISVDDMTRLTPTQQAFWLAIFDHAQVVTCASERKAGLRELWWKMKVIDNLTLEHVKCDCPVVGAWKGGLIVLQSGKPRAVGPSQERHNLYPTHTGRTAVGSGPAGGDAWPVSALAIGSAGQAAYLLYIRADGGRAKVGSGGGDRPVPAGHLWPQG